MPKQTQRWIARDKTLWPTEDDAKLHEEALALACEIHNNRCPSFGGPIYHTCKSILENYTLTRK